MANTKTVSKMHNASPLGKTVGGAFLAHANIIVGESPLHIKGQFLKKKRKKEWDTKRNWMIQICLQNKK